MKKLEEEATLK
jgi:hypothetical protein